MSRLWCDFIVYTTKSITVGRILFENTFWLQVESKLVDFYLNSLLPQLVHSKGSVITHKRKRLNLHIKLLTFVGVHASKLIIPCISCVH